MKRFLKAVPVALLCGALLSGCGESYEAKTSTIFISNDGSIVSTDVEAFDAKTYDKKEFKKYAKEAVDEYNDKNGSGKVKLKDVTFKNDDAILTISYKTYEDYMKFSGIDAYVGTVSDAVSEGYDIDADFVYVKDGKAVKKISKSKILDDNSAKIAIVKANVNVKVDGDIEYASAKNVKVLDNETVEIANGNDLLDSVKELSKKSNAKSSKDNSSKDNSKNEKSKTNKSAKKASKESADTSVDDDDLAVGTESESEVKFDFSDSSKHDNQNQISDVFTYIIYK